MAQRHSVFKPIHVMFTSGAAQYQAAVLQGIERVLDTAGYAAHIPVTNYGVWNEDEGADGEPLTPWQSVGWYLQHGFSASDRQHQINADQILRDLRAEPWQKSEPHYDVFVVDHDMYGGGGDNFAIGLTSPGFASVISAARFADVHHAAARTEYVKTVVMHEVGHLFGLVSLERRANVEDSLGLHCTNQCIMRQGLSVPVWYRMTNDRLAGEEFCDECRAELHTYFQRGSFVMATE